MGISSMWHWLIVLAVVMLIFGTRKLGSIGSDLGKAVKGFKDGMKEEEEKPAAAALAPSSSPPNAADTEAKPKSAG